jgi:hypothetical protein
VETIQPSRTDRVAYTVGEVMMFAYLRETVWLHDVDTSGSPVPPVMAEVKEVSTYSVDLYLKEKKERISMQNTAKIDGFPRFSLNKFIAVTFSQKSADNFYQQCLLGLPES